MSRTRAVITAVLCTPVLALSACSGSEPEPKIAPTPSSTAPTSASTSPVATLSAVDTIRAWVDAQNVAMQTGDTRDLESFSAPNCRGCSDFIRPIQQVYDAGGNFSTDGWEVIDAKVKDSGSPATVDAAVSMAAGETVLKAGQDPVAYDADKRIMQFKLVPVGTAFQIAFVGFVE